MKNFIFAVLLLSLLSACPANAGVRGTVCDGCSQAQMAARATQTTPEGTVYVFNALGAIVRKYHVITEILDLAPYTAWTQAVPVEVESSLENAFADYVHSHDAVRGDGDIQLPPDFPVLSVAGALAEPGSTATHIEQFLGEQGLFRQLQIDMGALATNILKRNVPLVDLSGLFKVVKITVRFQDGSSLDYEIYYSVDAISGEARLEVEATGNALMSDGTPAPTGPLGFEGLQVRDVNGSIREWIIWAQLNSAAISGSGIGTTMICSISGSEIHCVVRNRS